MAENNNIDSLKLYDANKVTAAIRLFHEHCGTFDKVAVEILSVKNDVQDIWKGCAADMFVEKFKTVYSQVTDIGDALYSIYEMLQQAQDAFYQADDSLNQQMKQAAHNDSKKKGGSGSSGSGDSWSMLEVGEHNTPEAYVPNITYPPMKPIPVPQSTMGDSYNPNFFYENFQAMPVIGHAVPSPYTVQMLYDNMTVKDIIAHNVGEAAQYVLNYDPKNPLDVIEHDVPEANVPELTYDAMTPKEVVPHNVPEAYVPEFAYEGMNPQDVVEHGTGEPTRPGFSYDGMNPQDVVEHGTGEAERPEFAYEGMAPLDVVEHGTEEANTPEFAYEAMAPKDVVEHGTGEAYTPEFVYEAMAPKDVTPHDVPEAYVPEFTYATMMPVEVPQSTVGEMYFPAFMEMPMSRKDRLYSSISAGVVNTMAQGMAEGVDPTTLKMTLGSSVIDMLAPSNALDGDTRQKLAMDMGNKVYETICGTAEAPNVDVMEGLVDNSTAWTKNNMNSAIGAIMEGAATPVCKLPEVNPWYEAGGSVGMKPVPAVADAANNVDLGSVGRGLDQKFHYMTPANNNAASLLGSSGAEGIDASGLSNGMKTVADFSMRMSVTRVLTDPSVKSFNADVDTSGLVIPVVSCVPSLTETKVDCSNGEVTWTLNSGSTDTVMNNALIQFANSPHTVSGESADALRNHAASTMSATSLRLPDMSARFN